MRRYTSRTAAYPQAGSPAAAANRSQSARCPRDQVVTLMLPPPPNTRPIAYGMARPLTCGLGAAVKPHSRSLPRLVGHWSGSSTAGTSSLPPASSRRTVTSGLAASWPATTQPAEPAPQTT